MATIAICPIDAMTLDYLRLTSRDEAHVAMVEAYAKEQGLFRTADSLEPVYTSTIELDLSTVEPSLAGPKRPQDRVSLRQSKLKFEQALEVMLTERKPKAAVAEKVAEKHGEDSAPAAAQAGAAVASADGTVPATLRRAESSASKNGVVVARCGPAGELATGSLS